MTIERVAYVVNTFPKISETFILGEIAEVCRRGIEVRILALKTPREQLAHDAVRRARLLECTSYVKDAFGGVLDAFKPDLVHAHFATEPTETARALAAARGLPFTFTAHGYDVYRRPPADLADRAAASAGIVTVSQANSRYMADRFGIPAERIHVIPCGVDVDWFTPGGVTSDPPLIVCVARLNEVKQLDRLLHACAALRSRGTAFRCVIVGEGPERPGLERLRRELDLDALVAMPGAAEHAQVRRWWRKAAVAVLSSRSEGMPVSLMEAAACGVPAVAPAVGGVPELIADGETGFVTTGEPASIAAALHELLTNGALRGRMRAAARHRAVARFSRAHQVSRLVGLWSRILN